MDKTVRSGCVGPSQAEIQVTVAGQELTKEREDFWIGKFIEAMGEGQCWKSRALGAIGAVDTFNAGLAKR